LLVAHPAARPASTIKLKTRDRITGNPARNEVNHPAMVQRKAEYWVSFPY
jgi:hypothetical protein